MENAEKIIKSAKSSDINVLKAEELLVKASSSIVGKEYRDALTQATQSKDVAMTCFEDGIQSIIDSADKLAELTKNTGTDSEQAISLLKDSKNALTEKNFERAMNLAKQSWGVYEKIAQEHLSESYSQAQSMIVLARNIGEDVSATEDLLEQARKSMENQDYFTALGQLKECMDFVGSGLSTQVEALLDEAKGYMVTAKELDTNVNKVVELITRTETEISESNLEAALSSARLSKSEAEKTLNRGISDNLENLLLQIQEAEKIDASMDKANEILTIGRNMLKEGNYTGSIEAIKELNSEIYHSQFQGVLSTMSQSRSKFIAANKIGADLTQAMEFLNDAKGALKEGDFVKALNMAKKGDEVVDSIVADFEDIENTIAALDDQVKMAKGLGTEVKNVESSLTSAKESLEARDFESVQAYVKQAKEEISSALYSFATECIEISELVISAGDKLGANLKEPEAMMKQAIDAAKSGNYQKSIELSGESTKRAEEIIKIHVSNTIASVELAMYDAENVDVNLIQNLLSSAKVEFEKNAYDRSFEHADKALNMLETSQSTKARELFNNLNKAILKTKDMGCEISSLEESIKRCDTNLKNRDFFTAIVETEKALNDARNMQYVAAERMFGEGKLAAIEAKKLGIDISDMKEALKRAKTAFSKADFTITYKESLSAKNSADNQIKYYQKAYDAINQAAAILAEAKKNKAEAKEPMGILLSAKGMFERFEYENALKEAEKAKIETEKIMTLYSAANTLHFVEESIEILKTLGVENTELDQYSTKLADVIKAELQQDAIAIAGEVELKTQGLLNTNISNLLSSTESLLMDAKELNLIVTTQEELLHNSRKSFENKRYKEAVELAKDVKSQIEDIRKMSQRAAMEIKAAQDVLNEGENLHANMAEPKKLLENSLIELNGSKYKESIESAIKSANASRKTIEKYVSDTIKAFRVSIEKAKLEGINVLAAEKLMEKAVGAFNSKDYKSALSEAMKSEGELEKVGLQQEMAEKAIVTAETKLNDAQKAGIFSKKAKSLITQARDEMKRGNYVRGLEQAIQSGDELHMVSEEFSEAMEAINSLISQIDIAKKISANVSIATKLLADAESAKTDHDYKTATEIAKEGTLEARRLCHSQLSTLVSSAYKYTDLAGQYGIDVSGSSSLLAEAKTFMDTGKFVISNDKISQTTNDVKAKLQAFFEDNYTQSERAMAHAKEVGAEITASQDLLTKARKAFEEDKFKEAITFVEKSKDAIDLKKGFEREFIELTYEAEKVISNSRKFGINVKEAQGLFDTARTQKDSDYQLALSTLKNAIQTAIIAVSDFKPMLSANILVDRVQKGQWVDSELVITNKGKALAKDIIINIIGDITIEGETKLDSIRGGGGEAKLKIKMKFDTLGDVPVLIKLVSTRIMDGLTFEDESGDQVFVMEPKVESPVQATKSTFEIIKTPADTKCGICMGKVKAGLEIIKCSCGKEYHAMCGRRFGKCAGCGIEFTEKLDEKAKEDEFGDLEVQTTPQPTPEAPIATLPAEEPKEAPVEKVEPKAEEPKKVTKKKVALKF
ncbi:MAG: hypothetical protein Q7J68_06925 [Thermoplasmata archaeon]|nr:hypothetical protein [Thermoplasmata archaeon]